MKKAEENKRIIGEFEYLENNEIPLFHTVNHK